MSWKQNAMLLCGIVVIGCSSDRDDSVERAGAPAAERTDSIAHRDSATAHGAHIPGATGSSQPQAAARHGGHAAATPLTGAAHGEHAAGGPAGLARRGGAHDAHRTSVNGRGAAQHTGHAAPPVARGDSAKHAHHATARDTAAHAGHPAARRDTTVHAGHPPARQDTTRHAQHPPTRTDSAQHAHAQPQRDSGAHAAHRPDSTQQQHAQHDSTSTGQHAGMNHEMTMVSIGGGWMAIGMAQVFPTATMALPSADNTPLARRGLYLTQPALMFNLESPGSGVSFRTTLNFEGVTQPGGELTFGAWGEGFIDKRHPHTFVHEAMLNVNVWSRSGGGFSLSAGKGFAPYGTDDPMSRPIIKYPTNHHLSQILERFTLNGVYASPLWSVEVGVFGGNEPTGPWDFSNVESFANSWSARINRHFGRGEMGVWPWELSASFGNVKEEHEEGDPAAVTRLFNAALRHEQPYAFGRLYTLLEGSLSDPKGADGYFSVAGEASLARGLHKPYARIEYASRPEYSRMGTPDQRGFFRYDHDEEPIGSTRWLTVVGGYGITATRLPFSARPYVEAQWNRVSEERGGIDPQTLFGRSSFLSLSAGFRLFLGGEPMRMGAYGVLDAITLMHRMQMMPMASAEQHRH
jgi:hypothetical protein